MFITVESEPFPRRHERTRVGFGSISRQKWRREPDRCGVLWRLGDGRGGRRPNVAQ